MGLDIVIYDKNKKKIHFIDFPQKLHDEIFQKSYFWKSYLPLKRISDYYLSDAFLSKKEIDELVDSMNRIKIFLNDDFSHILESIIQTLTNSEVAFVHFIGD